MVVIMDAKNNEHEPVQKQRRRMRLSFIGGRRPSLLPARKQGDSIEGRFSGQSLKSSFDGIDPQTKMEELPVAAAVCSVVAPAHTVDQHLREDKETFVEENFSLSPDERQAAIDLTAKLRQELAAAKALRQHWDSVSADAFLESDKTKSAAGLVLSEDIKALLDLDVSQDRSELTRLQAEAASLCAKIGNYRTQIKKAHKDLSELLHEELRRQSPPEVLTEATPRSLVSKILAEPKVVY